MEEPPVQPRDGGDVERLRDAETRETDAVDGATAAADTHSHHRGAADKQKFNTLGYQRRTKQKVVTDFATVSKGASAGAKPRTALRQVLFSQGASDKNPASEDQGQLDVLKQYLEAFAVPVSLKWRWGEEGRGSTLEKNWTHIVHSHSTMSKIQRHQQEALWEFVHTELTYINRLIIIRDLVIAALVNLHQHGFLLEVTPGLLFSNLPSILDAHQLFWEDVVYPMLQEVRRTGKPFDPMMLENGCLQFRERFSSYQHYCWEEENNLEFARRQMESNPHFLTYIQWVETHPQCERMRLGDMQAKPHQRITKYPLLLKAMLKNTQDPRVQHTLRGMLSHLNVFLESINDYLRLKDEELALSISAQRVEGYEVEGINEEIDKHVREICQFDLTCPITGVGPGVIRKLLLEENLKVRGRKDSKLEVVALLFSDVLLMTKAQKKGERLKVVRPPLALDRTYCIALKDSCAFVLVEVGELRCAKNVYIFVTSSPERCSSWVSTIHQAKEMLAKLRETENNRQLEKWKILKLEDEPIMEDKIDDIQMLKKSLTQSQETCADELNDELAIPMSVNSVLAPRTAAEPYQPLRDLASSYSRSHFRQSQSNKSCKIMRQGFAGHQQAVKAYEWKEVGMRGEQSGSHSEEDDKLFPSLMTKQERGTWNHRSQSAPNLDYDLISDLLHQKTTRPQSSIPGGYPDVDYPKDELRTLHLPYRKTLSREGLDFLTVPGDGGLSPRKDSNSQSNNWHTGRNSSHIQSGDMVTFPGAWGLSRILRSPELRRRRPYISHHSPFTKMSRKQGHASNNSSSNSDSDYNLSIKRDSVPSGQSTDSHRVLKLGSLKPNQGMFWNLRDDTVYPDPEMLSDLSEPELLAVNVHSKTPQIKTQRRYSIPNIMIEDHEYPLPSGSMNTLPHAEDATFPISAPHLNGHPSPLEGLLERAKERVRDREVYKWDSNVKAANFKSTYRSPSPLCSISPSPPPSDGDRDTEWEEVELMRHRARSVSKGWREQLVDGDENDKNSVVFTNGVNVDWSGWCFDDDEVMYHLHPGGKGLSRGISQSLTCWDLQDLSEQEDGECSQV